ncbi:hypothetical protein BDP55DRAFT_362034 [Colletotrichum godetiae]|uniref:Uncharacterized protein n=1 Tax=Colletotrichum godetiae TaxID=1209918 RepID=A0AAJ0AB90_9PEZI|nr:uncharacterized protein BDP55DRAFT_362034 [Colletotrichum godetiae]KAK1659303.1 hypothetical protein BDP55DRAFT_362034 [Colletotrichum godetiae]
MQWRHPTNDVRHGLSCSNFAGAPGDHGDLAQAPTCKSRTRSPNPGCLSPNGGWSNQPIEPVPGTWLDMEGIRNTCLMEGCSLSFSTPQPPNHMIPDHACHMHLGSFTWRLPPEAWNKTLYTLVCEDPLGVSPVPRSSSVSHCGVRIQQLNGPKYDAGTQRRKKISVAPTASPVPRIAPQRRCLLVVDSCLSHTFPKTRHPLQ